MRYIADDNGYLLGVAFGCEIECGGKTCTEYTGAVPSGYNTLVDWHAANIDTLNRWHVVGGVLTEDTSKAIDAPDAGYDSGWIDAQSVMSDSFTCYNTNFPKYRKRGNVVQVVGSVKPTATITGSNTRNVILTLPAGYRPPYEIINVMQGSGNAVWECAVLTNGNVCMSRYRNHTITTLGGFSDVTASAWLPFSVMFFVN